MTPSPYFQPVETHFYFNKTIINWSDAYKYCHMKINVKIETLTETLQFLD